MPIRANEAAYLPEREAQERDVNRIGQPDQVDAMDGGNGEQDRQKEKAAAL